MLFNAVRRVSSPVLITHLLCSALLAAAVEPSHGQCTFPGGAKKAGHPGPNLVRIIPC